jgi:hypothetical protein
MHRSHVAGKVGECSPNPQRSFHADSADDESSDLLWLVCALQSGRHHQRKSTQSDVQACATPGTAIPAIRPRDKRGVRQTERRRDFEQGGRAYSRGPRLVASHEERRHRQLVSVCSAVGVKLVAQSGADPRGLLC